MELKGEITEISKFDSGQGYEQIKITFYIVAPTKPSNPIYATIKDFARWCPDAQKIFIEQLEKYNARMMIYSLDRLAYDRLALGEITINQEPAVEFLTKNDKALVNVQEWKDAIPFFIECPDCGNKSAKGEKDEKGLYTTFKCPCGWSDVRSS